MAADDDDVTYQVERRWRDSEGYLYAERKERSHKIDKELEAAMA